MPTSRAAIGREEKPPPANGSASAGRATTETSPGRACGTRILALVVRQCHPAAAQKRLRTSAACRPKTEPEGTVSAPQDGETVSAMMKPVP